MSNFSEIGAALAAKKAEMEKMKKKLLEKQGVVPIAPSPSASEPSEEAKRAMEKARAKLSSKINLPSIPNIIDEKNDKLLALQTVQIKDSLINRRMGRKQLEQENVAEKIIPESNKYYDPRLSKKSNERDKRSFNFVAPGTYIRQGQSMRAEKFTTQKSFNESDPLNKRLFLQLKREPVPNVEWWDRHLCENDSYDTDNILQEHISMYVEHPVPEKKPAQDKNGVATSFLTKKEKKKLRRIHREEVQKEKQIKVMLGIEKPPEARATLSNMTRVFGAQAFEDPTKIEQLVRKQMQERLDKHNQENQERKLTPEQRKQKKLEKLRKNETGVIESVVFKVKDISQPLHRKTIDHTTRDGALSGVLIICSEGDCNLVIAEGGPRAIKKFKRLMQVRLKWKEHNPSNSCDLIWEGILQHRQFKKFRFHECSTKTEAREILEKRNLAHYWDTAAGFSEELAD